MRITTPAPGYTGTGPGGVEFRDGAADVDLDGLDDDARRAFRAGPLAFYRDGGYGIEGDGEGDTPRAEAPADPALDVDPRELPAGGEQIGTRLRDAAVDPQPGDFLPPVNAGEPGELGNPHGPNVVAPGIHGARGPVPALPGPVPDDPAEQAARETDAARRVLVDGEPTPEVIESFGAEADAAGQAPDDDAEPEQIDPPKHSALKAEWVTHATRLGADPEEAEQLTVRELVAKYDRPAPNPART